MLLLASGGVAFATNHELRINEVMAGLNGVSTIQFVEIVVQGGDQKIWGPGPHPVLGPGNNTPVGRAMLEFRNAAGQVTGRFVFPSHAPAGGLTVLIATQEFAQKTGIVPDFIMPKGMMPNAGMVRFTMNLDSPEASHFDVDLQLAYGGAGFTGTSNAGAPNANALTILGSQSLRRFQNFALGAASNANANFQYAATEFLGHGIGQPKHDEPCVQSQPVPQPPNPSGPACGGAGRA